MPQQYINTQGVEAAALSLQKTNEAINEKVNNLKKTAKQLENDWKSTAGSIACSKMYGVLNYNQSRNSVIQNYINLLQQAINPRYIDAETKNTSLADQFK